MTKHYVGHCNTCGKEEKIQVGRVKCVKCRNLEIQVANKLPKLVSLGGRIWVEVGYDDPNYYDS